MQSSEKLVYIDSIGPQHSVSQADHPLDIKIINKKNLMNCAKIKA